MNESENPEDLSLEQLREQLAVEAGRISDKDDGAIDRFVELQLEMNRRSKEQDFEEFETVTLPKQIHREVDFFGEEN